MYIHIYMYSCCLRWRFPSLRWDFTVYSVTIAAGPQSFVNSARLRTRPGTITNEQPLLPMSHQWQPKYVFEITIIKIFIYCLGNPLICDCEMRWYKKWINGEWQVKAAMAHRILGLPIHAYRSRSQSWIQLNFGHDFSDDTKIVRSHQNEKKHMDPPPSCIKPVLTQPLREKHN